MGHKRKSNGGNPKKNHLGRIISCVFIFLFAGISGIAIWCMLTWRHLTIEQLIGQLAMGNEGVESGLLISGILSTLIPAVVCTVLAAVLFWKNIIKKSKWAVLFMLCVTLGTIGYMAYRLDAIKYLKLQLLDSEFIETEYVDPNAVEIKFPEEKRNLIYIYLESMETTYASADKGGAFSENVIPNLTELALDKECFSDGTALNGAYCFSGTGWTVASLWGSVSGLPLKISIESNMMHGQETFFPGVGTLGDILKKEGYTNTFLIGSPAAFGGRTQLYQTHGDYLIHDYDYALKEGLIPEGYRVWWGYEDEKLFDFAKQELLELSQKDEPFNLTMLTVDTHFEDGYECRLCRFGEEEEYLDNATGDAHMAHVMACSDRQLAAFIGWIQGQDFYKNTTIVLTGDHKTMDTNFCSVVPGDYDRKTYFAVINSARDKSEDGYRQYSLFDLFPTTLSALGADIDGGKLGLGVDLYSGEATLVERYGFEKTEESLKEHSEFMEELASFDYDKLLSFLKIDVTLDEVEDSPQIRNVRITFNGDLTIDELIGQLGSDSEETPGEEIVFTRRSRNVFMADIDVEQYHDMSLLLKYCDGVREYAWPEIIQF